MALKGRHNDGNKGGDKGGGKGSDNGDKGSNKGGNKGGDKGGEGSNDGNNGGNKGADKIWRRLADGRNIWPNWNAMAASDRCADPKWDAMAEHHSMPRHKHDDPPRTRNQSTSISGDTMFDMFGIMVAVYERLLDTDGYEKDKLVKLVPDRQDGELVPEAGSDAETSSSWIDSADDVKDC